MIGWRRVAVGLVAVGLGILLARCQESPVVPVVPVFTPTTTTEPPSGGRGEPHSMPVTPIQMEKPRVLGPVAPPIVSLPLRMTEPLVRVRLTEEEPTPPQVAAGKYRGRVEVIQLPNGKFVAINAVGIDSYLQGVLAKELYGSWHPETYRAQAIAARTYALFQMLTATKAALWDVRADEGSQMYGGIAGETAKARAAVAATKGQVLTTDWQGQNGIFCTFYSACSGGATQDPFEAWGDSPVGPLSARLVGTVDANCPHFSWGPVTVRKSDVTRAVHSWADRNGITYMTGLGPLDRVWISKRNQATGRASEVTVVDIHGRSVPLRAEEFRLALLYDPTDVAPKLLSSYFEIQDAGATVVLSGRGYGHGIGMSQWGAEALAGRGKTAGQILTFYYPGGKIKQAW